MEWVTAAGAVIGACTGCLSLWWQIGDRGDRFYLGIGSLEEKIAPGRFLYVVNRSKHDLIIIDYGFVLGDGRCYSIPFVAAEAIDMDGSSYTLFTRLPPGDQQEAGADLRADVVAVFAKSSTQRVPHLQFTDGVKFALRVRIRWAAITRGVFGLNRFSGWR